MGRKIKTNKIDSVFTYPSEIYPRDMWIAIGTEVEDLSKMFNIDNPEDEPDDLRAYVIDTSNRKSGHCGALVKFISINEMDPATMAHEAVHIADYIYESLNMYAQDFSEKNEQYAYLVEWIVRCMVDAKDKYNKINLCN